MSSYWNARNIMTMTPNRVPDVPNDVVADHFNDPNFDFNAPSARSSSSTVTATAVELTGYKKLSSEMALSESGLRSVKHSMDGVRPHPSPAPVFNDESPYPEVRAAVSSVDDPTMPVSTFRMWTLGLFYAVLISGLNMFFSLRSSAVLITGIVAQLSALPLGKALEWLLPTTTYRTIGYTWSFNPGPFNIKEHVVITVMANVVTYGAYATDIVATQRMFYKQTLSYSYQILICLSTQLLGYSLGGYLRSFVVWPASIIWPGALVNAALFNTLHRTFGKRERGHMTRERFFFIVFICSAIWYWVPGYLFTALSVFNWICWIRPQDPVVNSLFGTLTGLGMGVGTFDWAMISYIGSPLVTPWWSQANTIVSLFLCFWIITPILYFSNTFFSQYLPISGFAAFDNTARVYSPTDILTNGAFDPAKYHAYSPVYLPATLAMAYGVAFASLGAIITHTLLWYRKDIIRRFRSNLKDEKDVHARLMMSYNDVPHWWYTIFGGIILILLFVAVEVFPTQLPIWGVIIAFLLAVLTSLPIAIIQGITNQSVTLQIIHEMIAGYLFPGRPVANMIFKTIAYIGTTQAVSFSGNMKLGHYMKVPPRILFVAQILAVTVNCFVGIGVQNWLFAHVVDICEPGQKDGFTCPATETFATASLIWGGIGPQRLFGPGTTYNALLYFFPIGFLLPIPFYLLSLRYPLSIFRYVHIPIFFAGVGFIPPATGLNYSSWALTGFIFNYVIRRYKFRWWMRYNYILSAGLDAGVALGLVIVFFTVRFPRGGFVLDWVGNTIWQKTADAMGTPVKQLRPGGTFGPQVWK